FSSRRRHTRSYGDWSSDVCSSDLYLPDGTMLVLTLNVKQLLQAPLVRGDDKAFKQALAEATKALEAFGVDPAKDVDRIIVAVGRSEERRVGKGGGCRRWRGQDMSE